MRESEETILDWNQLAGYLLSNGNQGNSRQYIQQEVVYNAQTDILEWAYRHV